MTARVPVRARRLRAAGALAAAFAVLSIPTSSAASPPGGPAADGAGGGARLEIVDQSAWAPASGALRLRLDLTGATDSHVVRLTAHERLVSRLVFERTVAGERRGPAISTVDLPIAFLPADADGTYELTVPLDEPDGGLRLGLPGVYPLTVSLVDLATEDDGPGSPTVDDEVLTMVVTAAPRPIDEPLAVAWLVQLVADPAARPDGSFDPSVLDAVGPAGDLGRSATALGASRVPLTLQVGPETLATWSAHAADDAGAARTLAALREGAADRQVLAAPWVPLDVPALIASGLADELGEQLLVGIETVEEELEVRVDPRSALVDPVGPEALGLLRREALVDRVVVRSDALEPVPSDLTPVEREQIVTPAGRFEAAVDNRDLTGLLDLPGGPVLRAQYLLAGLSLVALEAPSEPAGLVLAPRLPGPEPELLERLLAGLDDHPYLRPVTLDGYFEDAPARDVDGDTATRALASHTPRRLPVAPEQLARARSRIASFAAVVGEDDERVLAARRVVLTASAATWTDRDRERIAEDLEQIQRDAQDFMALIWTPDKTVTLTGRRAEIPLTFTNETGGPITVRVELDSTKLLFPDGAAHVVDLPAGTRNVMFDVEARASGTFPLRIEITSVDGSLAAPPAVVTIRTTVFVGMGVWISIGAAAFLAVWWGVHAWRARRRGEPVRASP